ncbi:family 43 glycosylhydrolase [Chitinophaga sedimenti]|uniref:family 43 glycosylhydrolase n=1 Tax=Chitinophaga sedimenti TaxID=2033606 RepID=UPI00249EEE79|nr:family 43 glycosylhydrolase [Chitinophaga sedimenti]
MMKKTLYSLLFLLPLSATVNAQTAKPGNPVFEGWYADPEAAVFGKKYWIFPTFSAPYGKQVHFDAFSSSDLVHWKKHKEILDTAAVKWAKRAMWAPSIVEKDGKNTFLFCSQRYPERIGIGRHWRSGGRQTAGALQRPAGQAIDQ